AQVESLYAIAWLRLEPAPLNHRQVPRKAKQLLQGGSRPQYHSRSELEQAIVTILVNAGFTFEEVLLLFQTNPAAGKFAELNVKDPDRAIDWLSFCFQKARAWCSRESPRRKSAREAMIRAWNIAWPGRTGSTDRAVFLAHANLAHRSGKET